MESKICKKCGIPKSVDGFYKHKASCKECVIKYNKTYRDTNKNEIAKTAKIWSDENKKARQDYKAKYARDRRKKDCMFNLKTSVSRLIRTSINRSGFKKGSRTYEILGCSFEEFKVYLESKFESWMNWENKGLYNGTEEYGWDIDHIIPMVTANNEEDVLRLNHYTNLQPLCSKFNRDIKKDKICE